MIRTVVLLAAALSLAACSHAPVPGPRIDPALSGFIPPDTTLLAGIRLEAIEKTPLYQKSVDPRDLPAVGEFAGRIGIDPRKDLWELLYVNNGQRAAWLGHGMFSDEGEPKLQNHGDNRFGYKGFTLIGNDTTAVMLVNQTVMAMGDTDELKAMIDVHEKSAGPPAALTPFLARMPAASQAWIAYAGGPLNLSIDKRSNLSNVNKILSMIQSGTLYLDFSHGMSGLAHGTGRSDKDSEELQSGLAAMISLGQVAIPRNQPELQKAFDGLKLNRDGREVKLQVDEPEDLAQKLLFLILAH